MIADATTKLRTILDTGDSIKVIIRSVSRSGMSRNMDLYVIRGNDLLYLNGYVATVLKVRRIKNGELQVRGCGMDMAFAVVSDLSRVLFNDPYALKHEVI